MTVRRKGERKGWVTGGIGMEVDENLATRQRLLRKKADCSCISSSIVLLPRDLEYIHSQTPSIRHRTAE